MRIAFVPCREGAVEWYRLRWPAAAVERECPDWSIELYSPRDIGVTLDGHMSGPPDVMSVDLIVTQRPEGPEQVAMLKRMQKSGIAVCIDMDDRLGHLPMSNSPGRYWRQMVQGKPRHRWASDACAAADLVTGTTDAIESDYAKHGRWQKLPNFMPAKAFTEPSPSTGEKVVLGWSGWKGSHRGDLKAVGGAVRAVLDSDPHVSVRVVGDATWAAGELRVPVGRLTGVDSVPFDQYHQALSGTDIGIVPLDPANPMNKGKSSLKALEFLASGAPVIASKTPANVELEKELSPFIMTVDTPPAWAELLRETIQTVRSLRGAEAGLPGLVQAAALPALIDNHADRFAEAWMRAVTRRRRLSESPDM